MGSIFTHTIRIPGIDRELQFVAETDDEVRQMACDELGLHFLPEGTVVNHLSSERY